MKGVGVDGGYTRGREDRKLVISLLPQSQSE